MNGPHTIVKKLAHLRKIIPGDQTNIRIDNPDIEYLFQESFDEFTAHASDHLYCPACGSKSAKMNLQHYHFDMERICIEFTGNCISCGAEIRSCHVLMDQLDRLVELMDKKYS